MGHAHAASLVRLLAEADIVTLHCPATAETRGLLRAEGLARMKPGAILVNTARGELADDLDALEDAPRRGHLAAAVIDTLAIEPPAPIRSSAHGGSARTGWRGGW